LASLPQNDGERGATNDSSYVVAPESPLASSLPRKRRKGGRPQRGGLQAKVLKLSSIFIKKQKIKKQKACAEAARDFQNAVDEVTK
jgi:hypothetical protein